MSDNGPGIPPELHERIFDFNFSGRQAHAGKLGFGLWWVKTLMARFGGSVTVDSDGQHGTTFIADSCPQSRTSSHHTIIMPTEPIPPRALMIEDDPSWQQILAEILTDEGLTVDLADNVEAAVACIRATPHRLAIVDLSLGKEDHRNQDGLRILEAVRRHDPGCTALLLTGYATVELAVSVLTEFGALTCLRKETFRRASFAGWCVRPWPARLAANGSRMPHSAAQQVGSMAQPSGVTTGSPPTR